jgi:hypothetical protein
LITIEVLRIEGVKNASNSKERLASLYGNFIALHGIDAVKME